MVLKNLKAGKSLAKQEELTGRFVVTIFSKDGFLIGKLDSGTCIKGQLTAAGELKIGCDYRFIGKYEETEKYGRQFAFTSYTREVPANEFGVRRYLQDEAKGIGAVTAMELWKKYGPEAVNILRTNPSRIINDGILSQKDADAASASLNYKANLEKTYIALESLLAKRGFSKRMRNQCIETWGANAPSVIQANPFCLLEAGIIGAGFKRVDQMFLDLGGNPGALIRQVYAAWYALHSDMQGHTWHTVPTVQNSLRASIGGASVKIKEAITEAIRRKLLTPWRTTDLTVPKGFLAEAKKAHQEYTVAASLRTLSKPSHPDSMIHWPPLEAVHGLSKHQAEQVKVALSSPVAILTGGPGTGKTYTAAAIIKAVVNAQGAASLAAMAPTGKAAVRLTQLLELHGIRLRARTVHSTLGIAVDNGAIGFMHHARNPMPYAFLVVDEMSMMDTQLFASLLSACSRGTHILLIGDKHQLPPVGHGAPLRDMLESIPSHGELTQIHRNQGAIVAACHAIKDGKDFKTTTRPKGNDNLMLIETGNPDKQIAHLRATISSIMRAGRFDPVKDVQVVCAVNKKSPLARDVLNKMLQGMLNPAGKQADKNPYRVGDKIICLKNQPATKVEPRGNDETDNVDDWRSELETFVANGEIGYVLAVSPKATIARFTPFDRVIRIPMFSQKETDEEEGEESAKSSYDLGYAITVHKSQGSQCPVVIAMIDDYPGAAYVCSREWWFTAISRGEKFDVLIGRKSTIQRHCRKVAIAGRKTFLAKSVKDDGLFDHLRKYYLEQADADAKAIKEAKAKAAMGT